MHNDKLTVGDTVTLPTTLGRSMHGKIIDQSRFSRHSLVVWEDNVSEWYDTDTLRCVNA